MERFDRNNSCEPAKNVGEAGYELPSPEAVDRLQNATRYWQESLAVLKFEAGHRLAWMDLQILRHLARRAGMQSLWE